MTFHATTAELSQAGYRSERDGRGRPHWEMCQGPTCRATILWLITPNGKRMPVTREPDGRWQTHFANCPDRQRFLKSQKKGAKER